MSGMDRAGAVFAGMAGALTAEPAPRKRAKPGGRGERKERLTVDGYASCDYKALARAFTAECRRLALTQAHVEADIGLAMGTMSRMRTGGGPDGRGGGASTLSVLLVCKWLGRNPLDFLVVKG